MEQKYPPEDDEEDDEPIGDYVIDRPKSFRDFNRMTGGNPKVWFWPPKSK